jgi:hypothetical protein
MIARCMPVVTTIALMAPGCGGDDEPRERNLGLDGPTPTVIAPGEPVAPDLPSIDGYLRSASETKVVLLTADGDRTAFRGPRPLGTPSESGIAKYGPA